MEEEEEEGVAEVVTGGFVSRRLLTPSDIVHPLIIHNVSDINVGKLVGQTVVRILIAEWLLLLLAKSSLT